MLHYMCINFDNIYNICEQMEGVAEVVGNT